MKVKNPYYSANPSDPDVYHNDRDCRAGQRIPVDKKRFGTNGYRRCDRCKAMD